MSERDGEVDELRRDLAAAVRSGDRAAQVAIRARLDRVAGREAEKETRKS